jgi:hypothetical protein
MTSPSTTLSFTSGSTKTTPTLITTPTELEKC